MEGAGDAVEVNAGNNTTNFTGFPGNGGPFFLVPMARKIALLGCEGSFHHQAALQLLGSDWEPIWCATFGDLAAAAADPSRADGGVIAILNAQAGPLTAALEAIATHGLHTGETLDLPIRLHLAARPDTSLAAVVAVASHPVALLAATATLSQYPEWQQITASSTANAATLAANQTGLAAICGEDAIAANGLVVLLPAVDPPGNFTRFTVLLR